MSCDDVSEMQGEVVENLPNATFRVTGNTVKEALTSCGLTPGKHRFRTS